ncbi:Unknown protein, partial [Striga hermonthica]
FTIPCTIGNISINNALCDLGASINLMPLSIFKKLGLGEVKPSTVTLQLADRSITYPKGIVEDVLVKIDKFIFPVDFVVLEMEEDNDVPLILGRPFLATGDALIDVKNGELTLRVNDEHVSFYKAMKFHDNNAHCNFLDTIDSCVLSHLDHALSRDSLEYGLINSCSPNDSILEYVFSLDSMQEESEPKEILSFGIEKKKKRCESRLCRGDTDCDTTNQPVSSGRVKNLEVKKSAQIRHDLRHGPCQVDVSGHQRCVFEHGTRHDPNNQARP